MSIKTTGEIRDSGKSIKYSVLCLLLFCIISWFAWDKTDVGYNIFIVFVLCFFVILNTYLIVRRCKWRITLLDDSVIIHRTIGHKIELDKDTVRWRVCIPIGSRIYHVFLYDYSTKKRLISIPLDWNNVTLLFQLNHFGPMTSDEKSAVYYFRAQEKMEICKEAVNTKKDTK